ncbi:MAG: hypothetical protein WA708_11295 [Acidobacteriaceae bacterium]
MRLLLLPICGLVMLAGASCTAHGASPPQTASSNPKHVPRTPIDRKKAELGQNTWNPQWNEIVEQALPASLLSEQVPRDVRRFCPRFFTMSDTEKRTFWAYFFQALAGAEAGLNPQATVRHDEPKLARREKVAATRVRTEGLLQLTYADQTRYGCPFDEQADRGLPAEDPARTILQPKNNLSCGVMILENQLITQRKPLLSPTSYWATLRPGTISYRIFAKQMTNPPAACGLHVRGRRKAFPKQIAQ